MFIFSTMFRFRSEGHSMCLRSYYPAFVSRMSLCLFYQFWQDRSIVSRAVLTNPFVALVSALLLAVLTNPFHIEYCGSSFRPVYMRSYSLVSAFFV